MYGTSRKVKPIHSQSTADYILSTSDVNLQVNATLESWILNAVLLEVEYSFLTKENLQGPSISLFFNMPISGYHYPKINSLGGSFGLDFNYYFT